MSFVIPSLVQLETVNNSSFSPTQTSNWPNPRRSNKMSRNSWTKTESLTQTYVNNLILNCMLSIDRWLTQLLLRSRVVFTNCSQLKHQLTTISFLRTALEDHLRAETNPIKVVNRSTAVNRGVRPKSTADANSTRTSTGTHSTSSPRTASNSKWAWFKWIVILHVNGRRICVLLFSIKSFLYNKEFLTIITANHAFKCCSLTLIAI